MTITIASYQRRAELERLLRSLAEGLAGSPELVAGLDVIVVLDGSTDGSAELVEGLPFPVPLRAVWQPNRGLAAARNAGLAAADGDLVWFLDDDLVLSAGLVARHRRAHDPMDRRIMVGPCELPLSARVHPLVRTFWESRHRELAERGVIDRFDRFSAANTSGPVTIFVDAGCFDEGFVGYGAEDYELAVRLLAMGAQIAYDTGAVAWHVPPHGALEICSRLRDEGRNQIRLVTAHPDAFEALFPRYAVGWPERVIRKLRLHRAPLLLEALATGLLPLVLLEERLTRQRRWAVLSLACAARFTASVARNDPDGRFTARVLGLSRLS